MKGNLIIMGCFAAGIAAARMDLLPAWLLSHDVPVYILSALIFQVGIGLGASNDLQRMKQSFGAGMILLPAATIIGTLLFSAAGVFLLGDRSLADCLALGSGFGYYSLSSVLIADMKCAAPDAAELATIALLANIIREMSALFGASLFARWGGRYAPISVAGINSMDVCLPTIVREAHDKDVVPLAVTHGMALEVSVPILIGIFCGGFF